ncbi:tail assembly protein [Xylophilus sp.]|uniref:tail assembly protein n=1 Tax=Xylophilus sp. TaxID=2653893 RepID=UPI0013BA9153|nr:tail assembly protein [Xylophilus sp.]KAF1045599.1 MAG: hypothetical protein GAK38_02891 [Xylophilus sp.]
MGATTILLTGEAQQKFGREFKLHLDTNSPAEAIRALCAVVDGFRAYIAGAKARGIEFAIWRGKGKGATNISAEQLREPAGGVIRIAPIHVGSKSGGVLQTIVGAVLIVIGGLIAASPVGTAIAGVGLSMVAGGVVQMLSPQPRLNKSADPSQNQASDIFNGSVNTTAQGNCVPVLYGGPMEIGSVVISAGIEAQDYSSRPSNVGMGTNNGAQKMTPYDPD